MNPIIKKSVTDWCAERFDGLEWCIAGGAVRDALVGQEPKDYDVFVLGTQRAEVERRMAGSVANAPPSVPYCVGSIDVGGDVVQVMACEECSSVDELLDGFDWDICRFAVNRLGVLFSPGCLPKPRAVMSLHRLTHPRSTLQRGIRLAARFDMQIRENIAEYLVSQAIECERADYLTALAEDRKRA